MSSDDHISDIDLYKCAKVPNAHLVLLPRRLHLLARLIKVAPPELRALLAWGNEKSWIAQVMSDLLEVAKFGKLEDLPSPCIEPGADRKSVV